MLLHKCFHRQQNLPQLNTENVFSNGYLQVRLTEINPPIEERVYVRAPSVTKVPFKKSRRTNRKQSKKPWRFKNTPKAWQHLAKMPGWEKLSKDDQMKLKVGWPDRHFCLSYKEISSTFDCSKRHAKRKISQWEVEGELKVEQEYLERRGKLTKIHKRNFCVFTDQGKKHIAELVEFLHADSKMSPRKDSNKLEKFCQDKTAFSKDKGVFEGSGKEYQKHLEKRLAKMEAEQEPIKSAIATIFELHGFKAHLSTLCPHLRKKINETPLKRLVKVLKFIEKKVKKGFRLRSFWAFFRHVLEENLKCWLTKRADDYQKAIQKETTMKGIDSQIVVEQIIKLQERTGKIASREDLRGLLGFGASHLSAFLKVVSFKLNITPISNWIGYTYFLSKKSISELASMYKSEKRIQAEKEKESAFFKSQPNQREACSWDRVLRDFEEGDRLFAVGESPEIWD